MNEGQLGVLIPIIAITLGLGIPMVNSIVNYKRKRALIEALNKERIAAIEKGVAPPAWPEDILKDQVDAADAVPNTAAAMEHSRHRQLTAGLVTLAVGLAVLFGLAPLIGDEVARAGLIPMAVGVALLIAWAVRGRSKFPSTDRSNDR